jgi:hypothetical protein
MADTLYLSLWYPNLRLEALPDKLTAVLEAFAAQGGEKLVYATTVWPVSWSEAAVFQRVYGRTGGEGERGVPPRQAVEDATELLHDDYAYEFQIGWSLWELESARAEGLYSPGRATADLLRPAQGRLPAPPHSAQDDARKLGAEGGKLLERWVREPRLVRVTGYGPLFDEGAYEQDGHIKIDFGSDAPFIEEGVELDAPAARHVEENVRQLVKLAGAVEKGSGATARILWSELGESLAQRLAARLGTGN